MLKTKLSIFIVFCFFLFTISACNAQEDKHFNLKFIISNYGNWLSAFDKDLEEFNSSFSNNPWFTSFPNSICPDSKLPDTFYKHYKKKPSHKNKLLSINFTSNVFRLFHNSVPIVLVNKDVITDINMKQHHELVYLKVNESLSDFNPYQNNDIPNSNTFSRKSVPFAIFCRHNGKLKLNNISKELAEIVVSMTRYDLDQ